MKEASALSLSLKTFFVFLNNDCHQRHNAATLNMFQIKAIQHAAALCINYLAYVALYKQAPLVERWYLCTANYFKMFLSFIIEAVNLVQVVVRLTQCGV